MKSCSCAHLGVHVAVIEPGGVCTETASRGIATANHDDPYARPALAAGLTLWRAALPTGLWRLRNRAANIHVMPDQAAVALLAAYQGSVLLAAATGYLALLGASLKTVAAGMLVNVPHQPCTRAHLRI